MARGGWKGALASGDLGSDSALTWELSDFESVVFLICKTETQIAAGWSY